MAGVHRVVVEALGDSVALASLAGDYLPISAWGAAIERVRLARHPNRPLWEGSRRVGYDLAARFLDTSNGRLVRETIAVLPLDRALNAVAMPMGERLRRALEFDFRPRHDGGGRIHVRGQFVVSPATMGGFFEALIDAIPGRHAVALAEVAPQALQYDVSVL